MKQRIDTILLTGFGPFPGAPFNPTSVMVERLARRRHPAFAGIRRVAHVFRTSYAAVDSELPMLMTREMPDVVVMFGLAQRTRHLRVETRARNAISRVTPDAAGRQPPKATIAPTAPPALRLPAPAQRLVAAARSAGVPAAPSRDAGRYLCNYLCWRASEAAEKPGGPRLVTFIHVPEIRMPSMGRAGSPRTHQDSAPITLDDLLRAGEAIVLAALAAARTTR
jgi:pyroglutamyl-peptidase